MKAEDLAAAIAAATPPLIDKILPSNRLHLLAGISSAGKSRWAIPAFMMFGRGVPVLGLDVHPVPWAIIASDRPLSDVHDTIRSMGFKPSDVNVIPAFGRNRKPRYQLMEQAKNEGYKLLLWEGLDLLVRNPNNSSEVGDFCSELTSYCESGMTILGTVGVAKLKHGEGYDAPRQLVAGSSVWERCTSTDLVIIPTNPGEVSDPGRLMHVCLKNSPSFAVEGTFDDNGVLVFKGYSERLDTLDEVIKFPRQRRTKSE